MEIDLNLDNYDLPDLLKLFNLKYNFTLDELKKSKLIVMKLHPDKSGLEKEYFLFYCKAFRIIKNIYDFKNKQQETLDKNNGKIEYLTGDNDDKGKQLMIDNLLKKEPEHFHTWFNDAFDKINIIDEERKGGYGDWFKSDEDIDTTETTLNMMHQKITEKKAGLSALVKISDIEASNNITGRYTGLSGDAPCSYSSDIFSSLPYEDLKTAHTETVVPVCEDDYKKVQKFNNVSKLQQHRNSQNIKPLTSKQADQYLNNKQDCDEEINVKMAYKLARQNELVEEANKTWWSNLSFLK
jgi:hypothetical protein